jgi:hypothetical protein
MGAIDARAVDIRDKYTRETNGCSTSESLVFTLGTYFGCKSSNQHRSMHPSAPPSVHFPAQQNTLWLSYRALLYGKDAAQVRCFSPRTSRLSEAVLWARSGDD